jgi:hypothetical protein
MQGHANILVVISTAHGWPRSWLKKRTDIQKIGIDLKFWNPSKRTPTPSVNANFLAGQ